MIDNTLPFELRQYIERRHESIMDGNQADHRPTSQRELDDCTAGCIAAYNRGVMLQQSITAELPACLAVYRQRHEYREYELVQAWVLNRGIIIPRYVTLVEEVRKLRDAIFGATVTVKP
jgi:hypothetical protein